jgi:hypothetical protein
MRVALTNAKQGTQSPGESRPAEYSWPFLSRRSRREGVSLIRLAVSSRRAHSFHLAQSVSRETEGLDHRWLA